MLQLAYAVYIPTRCLFDNNPGEDKSKITGDFIDGFRASGGAYYVFYGSIYILMQIFMFLSEILNYGVCT